MKLSATSFAIVLTLTTTFVLAQTAVGPRIKIYSKNPSSPICGDYLKLLNKTPNHEPLPVCKNQIDQLAGATSLNWEVLNTVENQDLLYKLEWLQGKRVDPDLWRKQFQRRAQHRSALPTIKQAKVSIESANTPQLIYSYENAGPSCSPSKLAHWRPSESSGPIIFFFHPSVQDYPNWASARGYPFMYDGRLHMVSTYLNDKTHFLEWTAVIEAYVAEKQLPLKSAEGYQSETICAFNDTKIFYPPPKQ